VPRRITVEIIGDSRSLERAFQRSAHAGRTFEFSLKNVIKAAAGLEAVRLGYDGLKDVVREGTAEFAENQKVTAQTNAVIKSTGAVAGVSAEHIDKLGLSLSNLSGVNDETVRSAENVLLAFTSIRNEAGKGNAVFDRTAKAVLDFSVRTGRSATSAGVILGRALADPASKLAGLSRAGVVFTKGKINSIRAIERTKWTATAAVSYHGRQKHPARPLFSGLLDRVLRC
jgi:hypothetical protein